MPPCPPCRPGALGDGGDYPIVSLMIARWAIDRAADHCQTPTMRRIGQSLGLGAVELRRERRHHDLTWRAGQRTTRPLEGPGGPWRA